MQNYGHYTRYSCMESSHLFLTWHCTQLRFDLVDCQKNAQRNAILQPNSAPNRHCGHSSGDRSRTARLCKNIFKKLCAILLVDLIDPK